MVSNKEGVESFASASSSAELNIENPRDISASAAANAFSNLFANVFSSANANAEVVANGDVDGKASSWSVVSAGDSRATVPSSPTHKDLPYPDIAHPKSVEKNTLSTVWTNDELFPTSTIANPDSTDVPPFNSFPIPLYVIAILGSLAILVLLCVLYRCVARRRKRQNQLAAMTPKPSDPRMAGVRADQPIQFVVPTTIIISETTEDSMSDTDYSSGGIRNLPVFHEKRKRRPYGGFHINPEDIERGLYEGVTSRLETGTFLGDLGKIGFSLHFNSYKNQLLIRIIGARDLPCLFLKTTANPCVKVALMPDRTPKYITKIQRNTTNPDFNETFVFPMLKSDIETKKLKISVWDYDRFSRKFLLGQILYPIKASNLGNSIDADASTGDIWIDLKQESENQKGASELLLALSYNPDTSSLTLTVLKARYIPIADKEKETAVYAKVTLYVRRKLVRTKKTSSRRKTPEMELNSSFNVHVPAASLSDVDFLVTLCEKSIGIGSKRVIGRTQVGSNCLTDQGLQHWQDMLLSPKSTCAQLHILSSF